MNKNRSLVVHLNLLEENYIKLKKITPNNKILFMIKANAYGHGLEEIYSFSANKLKINNFGVATFNEALRLKSLPIEGTNLYVFSDFDLEEISKFSKDCIDRIIFVLENKNDLLTFLNSDILKDMPLCLKFNTGMNRLGFNKDEIYEVIEILKENKKTKIFHLMSHLANSSLSMKKNKKNNIQLDEFKKIKKIFKDTKIEVLNSSISNSGAIEQGFGLDNNFIRPGLMLYGPSSILPQVKAELDYSWDGKIISELRAKVLKITSFDKGAPIGYGGSVLSDSGIIVIIAIGYGDGITTNFSGLKIQHNGYDGRFFGRVNMDMSQLFFKKNDSIKKGDSYLIWNSDQGSILSICKQLKIIPYEIFCQITNRIPRLYTNN